ncbi:endonuclease domain-containing protein [Sphingomonas oligophenolica]|uniref:Endonuclease domain-containing protein n=1 Tax=Sphingomonas oligophenolica TaxID=301154 RepID=A0A502CC88_9SPHN|nr:endonuclease domain-containing protein [Sphingomonas oligophenolica]TPG09639.1 endonuclease domain-containing protein [Sphingomonas oligophenolica]
MRGNADGLTKRQLLPTGTTTKVRTLRHNRTEPEARLWRALRETFPDTKFRFQDPFGRYIADFCAHRAKLIIEIDGDTHATTEIYDANRTHFLNLEGYHVIRFTNADVMHNLDGVIAEITIQVPSPPVGEGGSGAQRRGRMRGSRET